jgi:hypothetical protein
VNLLSLPMLYSIVTLQRRLVRVRSWFSSRVTALGATVILTCGPCRENPNPSSVACDACRTEDFCSFTFSFSRCSITPVTLASTLWAARSLRTKKRARGLTGGAHRTIVVKKEKCVVISRFSDDRLQSVSRGYSG